MKLNIVYFAVAEFLFFYSALGLSMQATPDVISGRTKITVTWEGVSYPMSGDWIAIYSPPGSSNDNWIAWQYASESPTWADGTGSLTFNLVNLRTDYEFRYLREYTWYTAVRSNVVEANDNYPNQGHLSLTNNPSEMRIMWITNSADQTPTVKYGTSSGHYIKTVTGTTSTYSYKDMCGGYASRYFMDPGHIHDVVMTGLLPNTLYYYIYGNDADGWSEERRFLSPPNLGIVPASGIKIIAYGDAGTSFCDGMYPKNCELGVKETYENVLEDITKTPYNMLIHNGDISYAMGEARRWEWFFNEIEPIATRVPYMVSLGNHEWDWSGQDFLPSWGNYGEDSGGECGVPYMKRFHMPSNNGKWYSYDYGTIHFVFVSGEHNFTTGSVQWNWIENDLRQVDKAKTPWIIVSFHRPMYTSIEHGDVSDIRIGAIMREHLEPLFVKYRVDLVLTAHIHAYERTCSVYNFQCDKTGKSPVHVVLGMAGRDYNPAWLTQPNWSVFRDNKYGWTRIHVVNNTALHMQYVVNESKEGSRIVEDDFWIVKS